MSENISIKKQVFPIKLIKTYTRWFQIHESNMRVGKSYVTSELVFV